MGVTEGPLLSGELAGGDAEPVHASLADICEKIFSTVPLGGYRQRGGALTVVERSVGALRVDPLR